MTAAYVVAVTLAVVTALVLAPVVWSAASPSASEEPTVAVVTVRGATNDATVNRVSRQLREIRADGSIEAVVLRVDSPGGPVDSSEEFYLAVNRTAAQMPVVAYVEGTAASGGYFGIVPTDAIVVKSSSTVGSVGVIVQAPLETIRLVQQQQSTFVRSGPEKAQISPDSIREELELLKRAFVGTVMTHRGEQLTLSRAQVSEADTYLGPEAVENGFADRIGDVEVAIQAAASRSDAIDGDRYNVDYRETGPNLQSLLFGTDQTVTRSDGVVYVVAEEPTTTQEFVRPVRYWAVWGVPATSGQQSGEPPSSATGQNRTSATTGVNADV